MKCPLLLMKWQPSQDKMKFEPMDCLKEECACYDAKVEQCDVVTIAEALKGILLLLDKLADKMPHEEQFRR